jgi:hypothetical protein
MPIFGQYLANFVPIFCENIFKIITSVPGQRRRLGSGGDRIRIHGFRVGGVTSGTSGTNIMIFSLEKILDKLLEILTDNTAIKYEKLTFFRANRRFPQKQG